MRLITPEENSPSVQTQNEVVRQNWPRQLIAHVNTVRHKVAQSPVRTIYGVLIILFFLLVIINLLMPSRYARQRFTHARIITEVDDVSIEIIYPTKLFLGDEPSELRINVLPNKITSLTQTMTLRFRFPVGVIVSGTHSDINDNMALVNFPPSNGPQHASLLLASAGLPHSARQLGKKCGQETADEESNPNIMCFSYDVESPSQASWRKFWVEAISDKAPILLIAALLAPILLQIVNLYQRQRGQELKISERRNQLDQKRLERERAQTHLLRTAEARTLSDTVKRHLQNVDARAARTTLQALRDQKIEHWLPSQDLEWLEWLTGVADNGLDTSNPAHSLTNPETCARIQAEWPNELAGAYVCAMKKTVDTNNVAEDIRRLLGQFPLDHIARPALRDQYCQQWNKIQEIALQDLPQTNTPKSSEPTTSLLYDKEARLRKRIPKVLLPHGRAEWEETTLFGEQRAFFWPRHPIHGKITDTPGNQFVYGSSGCGRTALALALFYGKFGFTDRLRVYVPLGKGTDTGWITIRRRWAEMLLNYMCDKATRLFLLSEGQRFLLANVLVQALSSSYVVAHLPHMLDMSSEDKTSPEEQTLEEERLLFWQQIRRTQYELLTQAIQETVNSSPLSDNAWYHSTLACCKALGFSGVYLLLDYPAHATPPEPMIDGLGEWQEYGVVSTFFMPTATFQTVHNSEARDNTHELTWDIGQIESLLDHLLRRLTESKRVERYFADNARSTFIQSVNPPNPRQLVHFWRKTLQGIDIKAQQITEEDIRRAHNS